MTGDTADPTAPHTGRRPPTTPFSVVAHVLRGMLMGLAELVPGVSGGTMALITGVYERIIDSANHVVTAFRRLASGPGRGQNFRAEFARAEWTLIVPLLAGMGTAIVAMAGVMHSFVETQPELSRGLFLGMVAASVSVPLLLADRSVFRQSGPALRAAGLFVLVAAAAFLLTSLGGGVTMENPPAWLVFGAAAVAICALVLPGVSGSFLLLVFGLYLPTTAAVDNLDLGYLAVFAAGAIVGLALFVRGLHWLLHHHHTLTMVAMAGLMLGSLRALWPWQSAAGALRAPDGNWPWVLLLAIAGALGVMILVAIDRRVARADAIAPGEPDLS